MRIEEYGLIGDCHTAALVGRDGSIDWLCLPRFDSGACFASLLGTPENGRWLIAPEGEPRRVRRRYLPDTLVLETEFEATGGTVRVIDFMPPRSQAVDVIRVVEGVRGIVPMRMELVLRFDYGLVVPWVRRADGGIVATAGPDRVRLWSPVPTEGRDFRTRADFTVKEGSRLTFDLAWSLSYGKDPPPVDAEKALGETTRWWERWCAKSSYDGDWRDDVLRSLVTLKALTYAPTGGLVAAPTTSLPERPGGVRNWDYRYCWLRDATVTLYALLLAGYRDEAFAWRDWLLRAAAGMPSQLQIMYGLAGERRVDEWDIPWLPGYEGARPVRVGNQAHSQLQLDVFGEIMDTMHQCWRAGIAPSQDGWQLQRALVEHLETSWKEPDHGIWEVRGKRREFTYSKVMAWVAFDRAVKGIEQFGLGGPLERWRSIREGIHRDVCSKGYNPRRGAFTQSYGSDRLDASLLMLPLVGFLPASDPRVRGTVEAVERELVSDGFVSRYQSDPEVDGLPPGEGAFLLCSFWYADALALLGRQSEARTVFERVLAVRNDLGLLSESYDVDHHRLVGNFPQAFSHVGLVNTARNLSRHGGPAEDRLRT